MAKRKSKTARKKNTKKSCASVVSLAFLAIFKLTMVMSKGFIRLLAWLIMAAGRKGKTNPLAAMGMVCFFVVFAFVGANALFQSTQMNPNVKREQQKQKMDLQLMTKQDELAEMGLYDGEIDGLGGLKTWAAVETWQKLRQTLEKGKQSSAEDELAKIIHDTAP